MIHVERSALVAREARAMYLMVADIESYPRFLPWCRATRIHELRDDYVRATIEIDFRGVRQAFTTENINHAHDSIEMRLIDGPFKALTGQWRFVDLSGKRAKAEKVANAATALAASKVELAMAYEFASPILGRLVGPVFNHIANSLVDAFIRRADEEGG